MTSLTAEKPVWDATESIATLVKDGKEVGGIFPLVTINDRKNHNVSCAGHCCVTWNWSPAAEEEAEYLKQFGTMRSMKCFGTEQGTHLFTIRDMSGISRGIIVSFDAPKVPASGTYAGGHEADRKPRDIQGVALVGTHFQGGYSYNPQEGIISCQELTNIAKAWWLSQPVVNASKE